MNNEKYPTNWKHVVVHRCDDTGEIHIDGDPDLRSHLWNKIRYYGDLANMFQNQQALNTRVGAPHNINDDKELTEWIQKWLAAMSNEIEEARDKLSWKWWKEYSTPIDRDQLKLELIDIWHFLMSACLGLGMDANEFVKLYEAKLKLNHTRQDIGYDDVYERKFKQPGNEDNDKLFEGKE